MIEQLPITDDQMFDLAKEHATVRVIANDYEYDGWIVSAFHKRSGAARCTVEDINGRLFIHNAKQLRRVK